jgi:hypothetical protein
VIYLNLTKYAKRGNLSSLDFAIMAPQAIEEPKVWALRDLPFPEPSDIVPVGFKELQVGASKTIEPVFSQLSVWMSLIDVQLDQPPATQRWPKRAIEILERARDALQISSFASLGKVPSFPARYSIQVRNQTQPVVISLTTQ